MPENFRTRLKHAWNVFTNKDPTEDKDLFAYGGSYERPDRPHLQLLGGGEKTIISSIYTRMAIDISQVTICHAKTDQNDRYLGKVDSNLNYCLNVEANIDQTATAFKQDLVISLFDEGCVAVVPVETRLNPNNTSTLDILSMRVGKITQWYPRDVEIELYNDKTGKKETIRMAKSKVAIIENPFYMVMNSQNSTLKRLVRKLALLDYVDEQSGSGKLDLIVQLPYAIKTPTKREQADSRIANVERQLKDSKYGIAYLDATEKITQLNRPVDNNLLTQIESLTSTLYSQLGLTEEVFKGTASPDEMNNYYKRSVEPVVSAIVDEFNRKFLTKTARTQKQTIMFFNDPFKFIPVDQIADMADKFTRNEIMSSNEFRQVIGLPAALDPRADELRNKNLSASNEDLSPAFLEEEADADLYEDEQRSLEGGLNMPIKYLMEGKEEV